jgi:hypothetical protein
MAKPLFHDIVPPDKKSIKKIPIPERSRDIKEVVRRPESERPIPRPPVRTPPSPKRESRETYEDEPVKPVPKTRRRKRKFVPIILTVTALLVLAGLIFIFIPRATGATVTLTPRGQTVSVNASFVASKDVNAELPYQHALYEKDGKLTIPATSEEEAKTKASGVIRIFNNHSTEPQKLVANTRFETPAGKIFRISQAVTIPGKSGDVPGSVDVAITAEEIGPDYNVGLSDFTIPGFKGDPRYEKIFARSKTPIGGGFNGTRKKVDPAAVTTARQKIRDELQASLIRLMQQNIPENFIFTPGSYFIEYESLPDQQADTGVLLTERATFHGIMFKKSDLADAISKKINGGTTTTESDLLAYESLSFAAKTGTTTKPWESNTFTFGLTGTTTLATAIDTAKLKDELVGKPRKSLSAILASYPGVAKAQVIMRPFWKQSFPEDKSEITIEISKTPLSE